MENITKNKISLSVIIPITERFDPVTELYNEYKKAIDETGLSYEVIYVIDGEHPEALEELTHLNKSEQLTIITLAKWFGEATALNAAFSVAKGETILTLPAYQQIEPKEIPKLIHAKKDCDMVLARRWPRSDSFVNRMQTRVFNFLLRFSTDLKIQDAGCSIRVFSRDVIDEVQIYGDLHRFLPVIAHRQGFRVLQVDAAQSQKDKYQRLYSPGIYLRRLLDLLTIFFLLKFTKKPLRFFGLVGMTLLGTGVLATLFLIMQRLFMDVALADRPALIISSLLIVLGVQIIAIGLVGEIIIFTHAKDIKEYRIEKIIN
ncbi:MAG: glycosyltransferase [Gammaproteobacteria bacterium]|nr:glycosyltransferase [Gammaproteobacteria bacterium]